MFQQYSDLYDMLDQDDVARDYFDLLPDDVRHQIRVRPDAVHSVRSLHDYAESLIHGDG